jgi:signal recognition particle subunit SRP54
VFDKAKLVEKCVVAELVSMLDPQRPAFKPKKGKSNVVMFVGLQGAGKTTTVAK